MYKRVNGIQHVGVATMQMEKTWKWYRKFFAIDVPFFDSVQEAPLMKVYTNGETINKRAATICNLQGGCGMEVLQPVSFEGKGPAFEVALGDYGIFICKIKSKNVQEHYDLFKKEDPDCLISEITKTPDGLDSFYVKDPDGLIFQVIPGEEWYVDLGHVSGGTVGVVIGVSDVDKAYELYGSLLGYDKVVYDKNGVFDDWKNIPGANHESRRMLLAQGDKPGGGFAKVTGTSYIELVQVEGRIPKKIYENRIWGDSGFVHLGMDVKGMKELGEDLAAKGYPFTCDSSNELKMGKTRLHCTYIEDQDGTLIELIEVYKIPIMEKWGIFLNVEKRDPMKPLPDFMLKALKFSRIKD